MSFLSFPLLSFTYTIIFSKRRTVSLMVNRIGELVVRAPKRMNKAQVEELVAQKSAWIYKALEKRNYQKPVKKEFVDGELFWYRGEQIPLRILESYRTRLVFDKEFYLSKFKQPRAKKLFEDFYKKQAKEVLGEKTAELSKQMGLKFNRVTIRTAQTRWGSCSSLGNINFSWRLVMAPMHIMDYVVIHELAHLIHKNHSVRFWKLVGQHFPAYKEAKHWLNTEGHALHV